MVDDQGSNSPDTLAAARLRGERMRREILENAGGGVSTLHVATKSAPSTGCATARAWIDSSEPPRC